MPTTAVRVFKVLISTAIILAMATIILGAYTRLTHAGLGCPDWPGCYGFMAAPTQSAHIEQAQEKFPGRKVEPHKARNEMWHRYVAGLLGLTVTAIFLISLRQSCSRLLTGCLFVLVVMQAALGMWTVSFNLLPLVVLAHMLGGFALLSLLVLLRVHINSPIKLGAETKLLCLIPFAWLALGVLIAQIILGGWTASNYAALACHQLPLCEPGWQERFDLQQAFSLPLGQINYEYGVLSYDARLSIHVLHRIGAYTTLILVASFSCMAWRYARNKMMRNLALLLLGLLVLQFALGLINVLAYLPLINAVAHNIVAANLLMLQVLFIYLLYQARTNKFPACSGGQQAAAHPDTKK